MAYTLKRSVCIVLIFQDIVGTTIYMKANSTTYKLFFLIELLGISQFSDNSVLIASGIQCKKRILHLVGLFIALFFYSLILQIVTQVYLIEYSIHTLKNIWRETNILTKKNVHEDIFQMMLHGNRTVQGHQKELASLSELKKLCVGKYVSRWSNHTGRVLKTILSYLFDYCFDIF